MLTQLIQTFNIAKLYKNIFRKQVYTRGIYSDSKWWRHGGKVVGDRDGLPYISKVLSMKLFRKTISIAILHRAVAIEETEQMNKEENEIKRRWRFEH